MKTMDMQTGARYLMINIIDLYKHKGTPALLCSSSSASAGRIIHPTNIHTPIPPKVISILLDT